MTEPLFALTPALSPRQQAAYDYVAAHNGVPADAIGSNWHELRGKHAATARCTWCDADGRDVVTSRALKPLVTYKRTPDGNLYILRGAAGSAPTTLTREQAKAAGYDGYAEHTPNVACPREENPRIYCATCQGALSQLAAASDATGYNPSTAPWPEGF